MFLFSFAVTTASTLTSFLFFFFCCVGFRNEEAILLTVIVFFLYSQCSTCNNMLQRVLREWPGAAKIKRGKKERRISNYILETKCEELNKWATQSTKNASASSFLLLLFCLLLFRSVEETRMGWLVCFFVLFLSTFPLLFFFLAFSFSLLYWWAKLFSSLPRATFKKVAVFAEYFFFPLLLFFFPRYVLNLPLRLLLFVYCCFSLHLEIVFVVLLFFFSCS